MSVRTRASFPTLVACLVLAGCSGRAAVGDGPSAAPALPDVAGAWAGGVTVEGQTIEGTLTLTQEGAALGATFSAPSFGLSAEGSGTITQAGAVEINLGYNMQCPGSAVMRGTLSEDRTTLSGTVQASDCTGQMMGAFDFVRAGAGAR